MRRAAVVLRFNNQKRNAILLREAQVFEKMQPWTLCASKLNCASKLKMGVHMIRKTLLTTAAAVLATSVAYAGPNVTISKDNKMVSVPAGKAGTVGSWVPGGEAYSNFAKKYPNGLYFCCYGYTLSGPSSFFGAAYATATQWTQAADADVTKLSAAVGYVSGDHTATLTLHSDSGSDTPGAKLGSRTGTTPEFFGGCCGVLTVKLKKPVHLSAGQKYWISITTGGANFNAAPFSTIDQVNPHNGAGSSNGGTTWSGFQSTLVATVSAK